MIASQKMSRAVELSKPYYMATIRAREVSLHTVIYQLYCIRLSSQRCFFCAPIRLFPVAPAGGAARGAPVRARGRAARRREGDVVDRGDGPAREPQGRQAGGRRVAGGARLRRLQSQRGRARAQ